MSYHALIKQEFFRKEEISFEQIIKVLSKAHRTLRSARILLQHQDEEGCFQLAYESMLLAGRALVFTHGLRPRTTNSHKIVVNFCSEVLGEDYKILVNKFDRMRKRRNYLIYGLGLALSKIEAENAINTAEEFINKIDQIITNKNPQKKLI